MPPENESSAENSTTPEATENTPEPTHETSIAMESVQRHPQRTGVFVLLGLGAVLAFGAGAYAFGIISDGSVKKDVLTRISAAWEDVDTYTQEVSVHIETTTTAPPSGEGLEPRETSTDVGVTLLSRSDRTDRPHLLMDAVAEVEVGVDAGAFAFNEGVEFDFLLDGTTVYIKVNKLPAILALFGLGVLQGEWIVTELEDVENLAASSEGVSTVTFDGDELNEEEIARLRAALSSRQLITLEKTDMTDTVLDENGTHDLTAYTITLVKDEVVALYDELVAEFSSDFTEQDRAEAARARDVLAYILDQLVIDARVWIDAEYLVYRLEVDAKATVDDAELGTLLADEGGAGGSSESAIKIDATFSDFNQPVSIEFPENARPIEEILESMGMRMDASTDEDTMLFPEPETPAEVSERTEFLNNMANVLAPFGFE